MSPDHFFLLIKNDWGYGRTNVISAVNIFACIKIVQIYSQCMIISHYTLHKYTCTYNYIQFHTYYYLANISALLHHHQCLWSQSHRRWRWLMAIHMRCLARQCIVGTIITVVCIVRRVRYMYLHVCLVRMTWHVA